MKNILQIQFRNFSSFLAWNLKEGSRINFRDFHDLEWLTPELSEIRNVLCGEAIKKAKSFKKKQYV